MTNLREAAKAALEWMERELEDDVAQGLWARLGRIRAANLRAALDAEPAPPFEDLRALVEKWRNREKDWHDTEGPTMRVAYDACADELAAILDSRPTAP